MRRLAHPALACAVLLCCLARPAAQTSAVQNPDNARRSPDVVFVPTPPEVVDAMLKTANVSRKDLVYDLGCGDGRIVIAAAKQFGARGVGVDIDPVRIKEARANAQAAGVSDQVRFVEGDLFETDLRPATVVTLYLLEQLNLKLHPKLVTELRPGTRIVSHAFGMTGWAPDRSETMRISGPHPGQGDESRLLLWIVPAEVRGVWQAGDTRLRIHQNFQQLELEGRLLGRPIVSSRARLRGREIAWEADGVRFEGRLQGGEIAGELSGPDGRRPLILTRVR